jgi:3-oxoacyl-[acyl-carrier protein] reductase
MNINFNGKIALVTGSNAGLGLAMVNTLAASGARVVINYLTGTEQAEEAVQSIRDAGGEAISYQADVTNVEQIAGMMSFIQETYGDTVDILINNAGHLVKRVPNAEVDEEHYSKVMDVNFKTCVFMSKAVIEGMKAKGAGKIINLTSLAAHDGGGPGAALYAAGKGAVLTFTKGLAKELSPFGINVNAMAPGFIGQTAFHSTFTPEAAQQATIAKIPLGRAGTPQDVANVAFFLASPLSDYLTGETIEINGGLFMK